MARIKSPALVVGLRHDGMVAPFVIDGPMNGTIFLAYVDQCLAPMLDRRDVVIMDNLPAHKVAGVTDAIEAVGSDGILSATVFQYARIEKHGAELWKMFEDGLFIVQFWPVESYLRRMRRLYNSTNRLAFG